jgi:hypothetical protein
MGQSFTEGGDREMVLEGIRSILNSQFSILIRGNVRESRLSPRMRIENWELKIDRIRGPQKGPQRP